MRCPVCKGEGGEYDAVIYHGAGGGPYYQCVYCDGTGIVGLIKLIIYKIAELRDGMFKVRIRR